MTTETTTCRYCSLGRPGPSWGLIGRGLVGWHAAAVNVTSSGGHLDPEVWRTCGHITPGYAQQAPDGTPVYDASEADADAFAHFVIAGPMVNPALQGDEVHGIMGFRGGADTEPRALDNVSVARYLRMLRERVPGVRFGTVRNGAVEWDL